MKTKECLRRSARLLELYVKKATSYKMVKGRLSRNLYNDDYLQARIEWEKNPATNQDA